MCLSVFFHDVRTRDFQWKMMDYGSLGVHYMNNLHLHLLKNGSIFVTHKNLLEPPHIFNCENNYGA